jgi:hypothetical protein
VYARGWLAVLKEKEKEKKETLSLKTATPPNSVHEQQWFVSKKKSLDFQVLCFAACH